MGIEWCLPMTPTFLAGQLLARLLSMFMASRATMELMAAILSGEVF